jgi:tetratricopeptide (TPR) repeat protein
MSSRPGSLGSGAADRRRGGTGAVTFAISTCAFNIISVTRTAHGGPMRRPCRKGRRMVQAEHRLLDATDVAASAHAAHARPRYQAFISYSHGDERMASRLHRWLETYRLPRRVIGRDTPRGKVPKRLTPIFRDRNELPASHDLNEEVRIALAESASLIVLCSPSARRSRWVEEEISFFRSIHPDRPVLAALLGGEPAEAFPSALIDGGREPIAADFRKGGDGKLARLKLVAGMTGVGLDELVQREAQRQLTRAMAITALAFVSTLILAALLVAAVSGRNEAERQRQQAEGLIEFMLTDLRTRLQGVGRLDILGSVNERAIAYYGAQGDLERLPKASLERRARVLQAMGEDDQRRGQLDEALAEFREAQRVTATLLAEEPNDPQRVFAHAQSEFWVGYTSFQRNRFDAARPHFHAYLALAQRLAELEPDSPRSLRELGYAHGNICSLELTSKADPMAALEACRRALAAMERVARRLPGDPGVRIDLANRHAWIADALTSLGRRQEALIQRREQSRILDALVRSDPLNASYRQDWMLARYSTALLLADLGEKVAARRLARQAREAVERLQTTDADNRDWHIWGYRIDKSFPGLKEER